jgi:hypothetical protein
MRVIRRQEVCGRDVVVLQHPAARQCGEFGRHRGRSGKLEQRHVTPSCAWIGPRQHIALEGILDRDGKDLGRVTPGAEQITHGACVVTDGVAGMRRRHPLVDDHPRCSTSAIAVRDSFSAGSA